MKEVLRTNDPIRFSYAESVLGAEGIESFPLDRNLAIMEGTAGAIQARLMVADHDADRAWAVLQQSKLGEN